MKTPSEIQREIRLFFSAPGYDVRNFRFLLSNGTAKSLNTEKNSKNAGPQKFLRAGVHSIFSGTRRRYGSGDRRCAPIILQALLRRLSRKNQPHEVQSAACHKFDSQIPFSETFDITPRRHLTVIQQTDAESSRLHAVAVIGTGISRHRKAQSTARPAEKTFRKRFRRLRAVNGIFVEKISGNRQFADLKLFRRHDDGTIQDFRSVRIPAQHRGDFSAGYRFAERKRNLCLG